MLNNVKKMLILIADGSYASFYVAQGPDNLTLLDEIEDPKGRLKEQDFTAKGKDNNSLPYEKDSKKTIEQQTFAAEVIHILNKFSQETKVKEVCIFAPAKFLGAINKEKTLKELDVFEVSKDLVHANIDQISQAIRQADLNFVI